MGLQDKRILLIDDDDDFYLLSKAAIEHENATLIRVEHPSEALEILNNNNIIDAVILDLNFDNKKNHASIRQDRGEAILHFRQNDPKLQQIPILVCSAENTAGTFIKVEQIDASDFLAKPICANSLIHKLKLLLED